MSIGREWKPARFRAVRDGTQIAMPASCVEKPDHRILLYIYIYGLLIGSVGVVSKNRGMSARHSRKDD